jgi:hypothetical protein
MLESNEIVRDHGSKHLTAVVDTPRIYHLPPSPFCHIFRQPLVRQSLKGSFNNIHLVPRPWRPGRKILNPRRSRQLENQMLAPIAKPCTSH